MTLDKAPYLLRAQLPHVFNEEVRAGGPGFTGADSQALSGLSGELVMVLCCPRSWFAFKTAASWKSRF